MSASHNSSCLFPQRKRSGSNFVAIANVDDTNICDLLTCFYLKFASHENAELVTFILIQLYIRGGASIRSMECLDLDSRKTVYFMVYCNFTIFLMVPEF